MIILYKKCIKKFSKEDKALLEIRTNESEASAKIIVIGVAAIVPHNAFADSLMEDISQFVEENTEAEIIDEEREIL